MKKNMLLCVLFVFANTMVPAENRQKKGDFHKLEQDEIIKPCVVGFKKFDAQKLLELEEKHREVLAKIANPSCTERCIGIDNHTITRERLQEVTNMPEDVRADMRFEIVPVKKSSCIQWIDCNNCKVDRSNGCPVGLFMGGVIGVLTGVFGGVMPAMITATPEFLSLLASVVVMPICGATCEAGSECVYYRCCAEREVWRFDNHTSGSSEKNDSED